MIKRGSILTVYTRMLHEDPIIEVQVDEVIYSDEEQYEDATLVLGYSSKIVGTDRWWLILPEDIILENTIH